MRAVGLMIRPPSSLAKTNHGCKPNAVRLVREGSRGLAGCKWHQSCPRDWQTFSRSAQSCMHNQPESCRFRLVDRRHSPDATTPKLKSGRHSQHVAVGRAPLTNITSHHADIPPILARLTGEWADGFGTA